MSNIIQFVKGDTYKCHVIVTDTDGSNVVIPSDCKIYLTVKQNPNSDALIALNLEKGIVLEDNKIGIKFEPEMTQNMQSGSYKYDVQLTMSTGDKYTIISNEKFILIPEITSLKEEVPQDGD